MAARIQRNLVDDRVPERRDSHASSSHEPSSEPTPTRSVDLVKKQCLYSLPSKTEIGPRAEDALTEPYFVQKISVT